MTHVAWHLAAWCGLAPSSPVKKRREYDTVVHDFILSILIEHRFFVVENAVITHLYSRTVMLSIADVVCSLTLESALAREI